MEITFRDKLLFLSKPKTKKRLVLVQQHEIERIRLIKKPRIEHYHYVEQLYNHYSIKSNNKTYLH